jgi:hypothetical protein
MKSKVLSIFTLALTLLSVMAENSEQEKGKKDVDTPILKVTEEINALVDEAANKVTESAGTIVIEKEQLESFFNGAVASQSWAPTVLKEKFAELLASVTAKIAEDIKKKIPQVVADLKKAVKNQIAGKTPNANFSAYWAHPKDKPDQNKWSGGDVAKKGLTGINASVTFEASFNGGIAAGVAGTVEVKASFTRSVEFSLTNFTSVDPKTAEGKEITIKGTPNYDKKDTVGATTKTFVGMTVSVGSTNSGQLEVVEGTLKCD